MEQQFPGQGIALAKDLQDKVLDAGRQVYEYCRKRGIVFLDSKFEIGVVLGPGGSIVEFIFIDEAVTPDSSRFCKVEDWEAGRLVPFDKELIRQIVLQAAVKAGFPMGSEDFEDFVGQYRLPAEIIEQTTARYEEIERILIS